MSTYFTRTEPDVIGWRLGKTSGRTVLHGVPPMVLSSLLGRGLDRSEDGGPQERGRLLS